MLIPFPLLEFAINAEFRHYPKTGSGTRVAGVRSWERYGSFLHSGICRPVAWAVSRRQDQSPFGDGAVDQFKRSRIILRTSISNSDSTVSISALNWEKTFRIGLKKVTGHFVPARIRRTVLPIYTVWITPATTCTIRPSKKAGPKQHETNNSKRYGAFNSR